MEAGHGTVATVSPVKETGSEDVFIYRVIISSNRPQKIVKINVHKKTSVVKMVEDSEESYNAGQVCINDRVFQIGGKPHYSRMWEIFSDTGKMERRGNMINGRQYPGCLVVYNPRPQIYVLGGTNQSDNMMTECEVYDLNSNRFNNITPLPVPKSSVCICQFNNEWLYTFGGFGGPTGERSALDRIDRINVINNNIRALVYIYIYIYIYIGRSMGTSRDISERGMEQENEQWGSTIWKQDSDLWGIYEWKYDD